MQALRNQAWVFRRAEHRVSFTAVGQTERAQQPIGSGEDLVGGLLENLLEQLLLRTVMIEDTRDLVFVVGRLCRTNVVRGSWIEFDGNASLVANAEHVLIFTPGEFIANEGSDANVDADRWFGTTRSRRGFVDDDGGRICRHLDRRRKACEMCQRGRFCERK